VVKKSTSFWWWFHLDPILEFFHSYCRIAKASLTFWQNWNSVEILYVEKI